MAEVATRGPLNSSFWFKALKVHQWEEKKAKKQKKNDKLICKTAPPGINSFNFNKPSVSHSEDLLYGNEEWIITGSRKYTTCLVLITYRSLNEKINKETHSCNNLIARKHFWCGARERQKPPPALSGGMWHSLGFRGWCCACSCRGNPQHRCNPGRRLPSTPASWPRLKPQQWAARFCNPPAASCWCRPCCSAPLWPRSRSRWKRAFCRRRLEYVNDQIRVLSSLSEEQSLILPHTVMSSLQ